MHNPTAIQRLFRHHDCDLAHRYAHGLRVELPCVHPTLNDHAVLTHAELNAKEEEMKHLKGYCNSSTYI